MEWRLRSFAAFFRKGLRDWRVRWHRAVEGFGFGVGDCLGRRLGV